MKTLTLEHLSPYLPYKLKLYYEENDIRDMMYLDSSSCERLNGLAKPILRSLSNLTKDELRGQGFDSHIDFLTHEKRNPLEAPYKMVEYLFSKHFDVFGLIEQGLAIGTNTLNQSK